MRHFETVTRECAKQVFRSLECDLCHRTAPGQSWGKRFYQENIEVERSFGELYPEGGELTIQSVDLCPQCFERMLAWVREQGGTVHERELDI